MKSKTIRPRVYDTENTSKEYWEQVLRDEGLSMTAGIHMHRGPDGKERRNVVFAGSSMELEILHKMQLIEASGRVRPEGFGPDESTDEENNFNS